MGGRQGSDGGHGPAVGQKAGVQTVEDPVTGRMVAGHPAAQVLQERLGIEWNLLSRNARALSTALAS